MNIVVCCKQVPDPEAPPASFKIDEAANKVAPAPGVNQVISPFDEQAVEAALKIKDAQEATVRVVTMGTDLVSDVVKKPLAMGLRLWGSPDMLTVSILSNEISGTSIF